MQGIKMDKTVVVVVVAWYWSIHDMTEALEVTEVEYLRYPFFDSCT